MRDWRAANPMKAAYFSLRDSARKRHKPFTITFEQFEQYCYETKYISRKGRDKKSHTVDCIEAAKGYVPGNIQPLTLSQNARKGTRTLVYDWRSKTAMIFKT